jgi:hypothetical protein
VADGAVLLLLATFGMALRMHEINAQTAQFAMLCALLLGASLSLYKPLAGTLICGLALLLLGSTTGLMGVLPEMVWIALLSCQSVWHSLRRALPWLLVFAFIGFAAPFALAKGLGQAAYINALWAWNVDSIGLIPWSRLKWLLSNLPFFAWPAIPFAAAAIWRWRRFYKEPHVWAGLSFTGVFFYGTVMPHHSQ